MTLRKPVPSHVSIRFLFYVVSKSIKHGKGIYLNRATKIDQKNYMLTSKHQLLWTVQKKKFLI